MPRLATLSAFLLTIPFASQAQWTQACGECAIGEERTLPEARNCAFRNAVEAALNASGLERIVQSTTTLQSAETAKQSSQLFVEASAVTWKGGVRGEREGEYTTKIDDLGDVVVAYCAEFDVVGYSTAPSPAFRFQVEGLQSVYEQGAKLEFEVVGPAGYLQAFLLEGEHAYRFLPNPNEPTGYAEPFARTAIPAPASQQEYELTQEPGEEGPWSLVFVFTNADLSAGVPDQLAARDLMFWMQAIEPENRFTLTHPFVFAD